MTISNFAQALATFVLNSTDVLLFFFLLKMEDVTLEQ